MGAGRYNNRVRSSYVTMGVGLYKMGVRIHNHGTAEWPGKLLLIQHYLFQILIFSSLTFVFEKENPKETKFKTMLDAYWWALITMTTVTQTE